MAKSDYKRGSIFHWEKDCSGKTATLIFTKPLNDWGYFDIFRYAYLEKLLLKNKDILAIECGCGSASVSAYFASKGVKTVMLDASFSALKIARENFRRYDLEGIFINGNMENLPFYNEKFDLVMSFGVLEHFEDMAPAIKEMNRILKPSGVFFAAVSPKKYSVQILGNLINTLMRFLYNIKHRRFKEAFLNSYPANPGFYENSYSSREYIRVIQQCGLKNVKLSGCRPFPSLDLTPEMYKIYIMIMKMLKPLHILFENHSCGITKLLGVEWNIIAVKK